MKGVSLFDKGKLLSMLGQIGLFNHYFLEFTIEGIMFAFDIKITIGQ